MRITLPVRAAGAAAQTDAAGEARGHEQEQPQNAQGLPHEAGGILQGFQALLIHDHIPHARQSAQALAHFDRLVSHHQVRPEGQFQAFGNGLIAEALQDEARFPGRLQEALGPLPGGNAPDALEAGIALEQAFRLAQEAPFRGEDRHLGLGFHAGHPAVQALHRQQAPTCQDQARGQCEDGEEMLPPVPEEILGHVLQQNPQEAQEEHQRLPMEPSLGAIALGCITC